MTATTENDYDKIVTGFKPFYLITFFVAMVWVGISPVLVPSYILSVTGSATDVALMLSLMSLGAFAVPLLTSAADKYRIHRFMQLFSLLAASGYMILGFTQRPLGFALIGLLAGLGLGASVLFLTAYLLNGGYSTKAQANALALGSRMYLFGQVSGALIVAAMLAANLSFRTMFVVAGILPLIAFLISWLTTKPLEERLHITMDQQESASKQEEETDKVKFTLKEQLFSPFGRVLIGVFLVYAGWQVVNGQYTNYFYGAFGIDPGIAAGANAIGALLGAVVVGLYANWFNKSGGLPQFNFHALMRVLGGVVLVILALVLVWGSRPAVLLPMLAYILLMQLRPVQDIAYATMAARTAIGGAAAAQGIVALALAFSEITGNMSSGLIADNFGWEWVPVAMVVLAGLALIVGLSSRKLRNQLYAEAGIDWKTGAQIAATVPDIHLPPKELLESEE
jgi:MFS family permease